LISSAQVHVSRNNHSNDLNSCSSKIHPCANIGYAVKIAKNFDTVLLDSRYEFPHQGPLSIDKNLRLTSYFYENTENISRSWSPDKNTTWSGLITFHSCNSHHRTGLFKISANLTVDNLTVKVNRTCTNVFGSILLLTSDSPYYNLNIRNCNFILLRDWHEGFCIINPSSTTSNISILIDSSNIKARSLYYRRIHYSKLHHRKAKRSPKPFINTDIRNTIFDGTFFQVDSKSLLVDRCQFLGTRFEIFVVPEGGTYRLSRNSFTNSALLANYYDVSTDDFKFTKLKIEQNNFTASLTELTYDPQFQIMK